MEWFYNEFTESFEVYLPNKEEPVAYFGSIEEVREYINNYYYTCNY